MSQKGKLLSEACNYLKKTDQIIIGEFAYIVVYTFADTSDLKHLGFNFKRSIKYRNLLLNPISRNTPLDSFTGEEVIRHHYLSN